MIICHSRKFIFFSNPKTGSESLRALLEPYQEETVQPFRKCTIARPFYPHMPPHEAKDIFQCKGWRFENYGTFTCVRNPYARLVSLYEMIQQCDRFTAIRNRFLSPVPFSSWLKTTDNNGRGGGGWTHQRWRKYGAWSGQNWCRGPDGINLVQHVLRLEHLADELPPVLAALGVSSLEPPTHINHRVHKDYRGYYDAQSISLIAGRYAWDLKKFRYSFDI